MNWRRYHTVTRCAAALVVAWLGSTGTASATLIGLNSDLVYDDVLNITWTRQAGDGTARNWADANSWAASLVFAGYTDWRLPSMDVNGNTTIIDCAFSTEVACRDNELGYMWRYNLGGVLGTYETGTQTAVGGQVLTGIQREYWSSTPFVAPGNAWFFGMNGAQNVQGTQVLSWAWAVHPGRLAVDAAPIPEPTSLLLLGTGLAAAAIRRGRRRRACVNSEAVNLHE